MMHQTSVVEGLYAQHKQWKGHKEYDIWGQLKIWMENHFKS